jgi:hypothetical protein
MSKEKKEERICSKRQSSRVRLKRISDVNCWRAIENGRREES